MSLRAEFHDENGETRPVIRQGPYSGEMDGMARAGRESSCTELHALLAGRSSPGRSAARARSTSVRGSGGRPGMAVRR